MKGSFGMTLTCRCHSEQLGCEESPRYRLDSLTKLRRRSLARNTCPACPEYNRGELVEGLARDDINPGCLHEVLLYIRIAEVEEKSIASSWLMVHQDYACAM